MSFKHTLIGKRIDGKREYVGRSEVRGKVSDQIRKQSSVAYVTIWRWRKHRRGTHDALRSLEDFFPVQEHEALLLVHDLVSGELKDDIEGNLRRVAASTIWRTVYGGPPLKISGDKNLHEITDLVERFLKALSPGGGIVDIIPALNYLPSSLAPFRQLGPADLDNVWRTDRAQICRQILFPCQWVLHGLSR